MAESADTGDSTLSISPTAPIAPALSRASVSPTAATTKESEKPNAFLKRLGEYKEFIAILLAVIGGVAFGINYFVTQTRFQKEMVYNQCQLMANVARLNSAINENYYKYMDDKMFSDMWPYKEKLARNVGLNRDEAKTLQSMQDSLETLKTRMRESEAAAKTYDDALNTGNCSKFIKYAD